MRTWWWIVWVGLPACQPNLTGVGSGSANTLGEDSDDSSAPTSGATTTPPDTGGGTDMGGTSMGSGVDTTQGMSSGPVDSTGAPPDDGSTGEPATGSAREPALLVISGSPEHDFGNVDLGASDIDVLTVSNDGGSDATGMAGQALAAPFSYTGGTYPGDGGDCEDTLAPQSSCTIELTFSPEVLGLHGETLAVAYDGAADATRPLLGGGAGQSDNLIQNPGGEMNGQPPPSWTNTGAGEWGAGDPWDFPPPQGGSSMLLALNGPNGPNFILEQDIDVSQWATTIDQGLMRFDFDGEARSWDNSEDEYRIRVRYRDAMGGGNGQWTSDWQVSNSWQTLSNDEAAPSGTRIIRIELGCRRSGGDNYCDAYFDDLVLTAYYP